MQVILSMYILWTLPLERYVLCMLYCSVFIPVFLLPVLKLLMIFMYVLCLCLYVLMYSAIKKRLRMPIFSSITYSVDIDQ